MSAQNVIVGGKLFEVISYNCVQTYTDGSMWFDEAPWTSYNVRITPNCAPNGDANCDGWGGCECVCHYSVMPENVITINDMKNWHDFMWASGEVPEDSSDN